MRPLVSFVHLIYLDSEVALDLQNKNSRNRQNFPSSYNADRKALQQAVSPNQLRNQEQSLETVTLPSELVSVKREREFFF